jgi:hypothetical protein
MVGRAIGVQITIVEALIALIGFGETVFHSKLTLDLITIIIFSQD